MNTDKVCAIIISCEVLHNIAVRWKQPPLEDEVSGDSYLDDAVNFEETAGHLVSRHSKINFHSIISATEFPLYIL